MRRQSPPRNVVIGMAAVVGATAVVGVAAADVRGSVVLAVMLARPKCISSW